MIVQSRRNAKKGNVNSARDLGVRAAYLNVSAIATTLVTIVACVFLGLGFTNSF